MKFGFGKRIAGFVLAAAVAAGTFLSTPATAKAAAPLAKGIDVSKYQGAVNWSAVKNAGYSFAFIKAGSAKSGLDPYYAVNMAGATAAGKAAGRADLCPAADSSAAVVRTDSGAADGAGIL